MSSSFDFIILLNGHLEHHQKYAVLAHISHGL